MHTTEFIDLLFLCHEIGANFTMNKQGDNVNGLGYNSIIDIIVINLKVKTDFGQSKLTTIDLCHY